MGSCRDFTVLYMALCRSLGLACRFVSGYHIAESQAEAELHAWAEVYLPGAGWRGFDPTYGVAVQENHIALSASPYPEFCLPISGHYKGLANSKLETKIQINQAVVATFKS
jgi:transglutaminase-like putative cysteine protease